MWLPGRRCWLSQNPRPAGPLPGTHWGHTGTALPSAVRVHPFFPFQTRGTGVGLQLGRPPVTPGDTHLPLHEQKSASYFCVKCQSLELTVSCSQGKGGEAGPEVDLQKGTWHCALGLGLRQGPCPLHRGRGCLPLWSLSLKVSVKARRLPGCTPTRVRSGQMLLSCPGLWHHGRRAL